MKPWNIRFLSPSFLINFRPVARRRPKTSFTHIPVATWFPPGDEIAALMARLCVLREDLYIEFVGLQAETLPTLDEGSADYRRTYFYRNQFRTLFEIMGAVRMLSRRHKAFMADMHTLHPELESEFDSLVSMVDKAWDQVKDFRDDVGAHLQHKAVREGLSKISLDTKCMFQAGNSPKTIHYKFAIEIVGATFLRKVPLSSATQEWENLFDTMRDLGFKALNFVDILFYGYGRIRGLSID